MVLALPVLAALLSAKRLVAQQAEATNIYRFIMGVDVPEPAAFVALGIAPGHALRGSAPKPVMASVISSSGGGARALTGIAIDVAPYFLVGGGVRNLESFRSNSIAGRMQRVGTKTVVSLGAAGDPAGTGSRLVAIGVRATFHDPHDPALNTDLPERATAELARAGATPPDDADEDVTDRGVDLAPLFARVRREMRGRRGWQVSGGWGLAARLRGDATSGDSLVSPRHTVWLSGQRTCGPRLDVLVTVETRNAFRSDAYWWIGAALLRKTTAADFTAEAYYDTLRRRLNPGVAAEVRALQRVGLVASITSQPDPFDMTGPTRLQLRTLLRWHIAYDR